MIDAARTLAALSALLMTASIAIWTNWLRGPLLLRLDGQKASNAAPAGIAIRLLIGAFGLSAVAAVFAIIGWMSY